MEWNVLSLMLLRALRWCEQHPEGHWSPSDLADELGLTTDDVKGVLGLLDDDGLVQLFPNARPTALGRITLLIARKEGYLDG